MKKFLLFLMFAMFCIPWVTNAQTTVEIGDGTSATYYAPIGTLYNYSITEQLYTAEEIGMSGTIQSISFNYALSDAKDFPIQVYMMNVEAADLSTGISLADADLVFDGTLSVTGSGWATITLDNPFVYDGTSNLLIGVNKGYVQWFSGSSWYYTTVDNMTRYSQQDGNAYDLTTTPGTSTSNRPNIQMEIVAGSGPFCAKPAQVAVNYTGGTTAEVSWNSDAASFNIDVNGTVTNNVTNPYTLTGLDLATTYIVKVQAVCGGDNGSSDWTSGTNFSTDLCMPEEQCNLTFVLTDTYGDSWNGNAIQVTDVTSGIVVATLTNQNLDGTTGEETQTVTLAVCDGSELEFSWVAGSYPGETQYTVTDINNEVIVEGSGAFETFTFTPNCTPVTCARPDSVVVTYNGGTTAEVSWLSEATNFNIDVNGTVINNVSNPYTLTGLELATTYSVMVQANCGADGLSNWTNAVSFTTDACMPEDQCSLTFVVTDSYGDGWNGAAIDIYDYTGEELGDLLATVTNENLDGISGSNQPDGETQTITLNFCNGQELAIIWTSGNYDDECSYTITDLNGDVIAENDVELAVAYTIDCTVTDCRRPSDFVAGNIGGHSVELSWTENGPATEWVIAYMSENDEDITQITVTTNPYTLTGLTPETAYAAQVTPVCEVEKPSEVIYWTTDVACPAPTELVVNPLVTSAEISWNGFAETYDLEWAPKPTSTVEGSWLQYDNGTMQANVGSSTAGVWTWGVKYPSTMLNSNNTLSKIAFYEVGNSYYTDGTVTVKIYSGGDSVPATLLYTETIATEGTDGMREVTLSSPVQIDASSNLWITLTANATYCMTMSNQDGGVDSRWFNNSGNWVDFGTLYTAGAAYSFMIRGYIESIDWDAVVWTTESNVTSPTTLNDLSAESEYLVRVKANCGGEDGESIWSQTSFTTASACDAPNTLAAEVNGTTATLSWNAYQDSYTLRYRPASAVDPTAPATIILEANDVWEDGSGYMMLLDADTNTAGVLWNANHYIFVDGEQYSGGDIPASYFDEFEYKIPTGANGSLDDSINVVVTGSVTLQIPAGTYDYVIFNPTPGDRFYIASDNGEVGTAEDNFVFEPGVTYHFTMQRFGNNDGAAFEIIRPMSDWVVVENVTSPYELTGLEPETYYEWYVEGINANCTDALVSEIETFTTGEQSPQTIALQEGTNWVSFYVNVTLDDLKTALVAALPTGNSTAITIQSQDQNVKYQRGRWVGQLTALDMAQMYKITVSADCEVSFEGTPVDPSTLSITINASGSTWIAFPYNQSMTVADLYTGFAVNNDQVSSSTQNIRYRSGRWVGQLTTLEAGQGYIYKTEATTPRTFTFPAVSRNVQSR